MINDMGISNEKVIKEGVTNIAKEFFANINNINLIDGFKFENRMYVKVIDEVLKVDTVVVTMVGIKRVECYGKRVEKHKYEVKCWEYIKEISAKDIGYDKEVEKVCFKDFVLKNLGAFLCGIIKLDKYRIRTYTFKNYEESVIESLKKLNTLKKVIGNIETKVVKEELGRNIVNGYTGYMI